MGCVLYVSVFWSLGSLCKHSCWSTFFGATLDTNWTYYMGYFLMTWKGLRIMHHVKHLNTMLGVSVCGVPKQAVWGVKKPTRTILRANAWQKPWDGHEGKLITRLICNGYLSPVTKPKTKQHRLKRINYCFNCRVEQYDLESIDK